MTDDEARAILKHAGWIAWDEEKDCPNWRDYGVNAPSITLDGDFTKEELLAILHFADRAK